jgi:hypothetical protein
MSFKAVRFSVEDEIARLILNRPDQRNALDLDMRDDIERAVRELRTKGGAKALVITGAGGAFCAGGDLRALSQGRRPTAANRERIRRLHVWFSELLDLEMPVIAVVDGPAFGAGFNLALAADFILATPRAQMCAVFVRIGLVPDLGGLQLLPRIVGLQRAKEIIFWRGEAGSRLLIPAPPAQREPGGSKRSSRSDQFMRQPLVAVATDSVSGSRSIQSSHRQLLLSELQLTLSSRAIALYDRLDLHGWAIFAENAYASYRSIPMR